MSVFERKHIALYILLLSLAVKLALIILSDGRVYYDVNTALSYGRLYSENGVTSGIGLLSGVKTELGPAVWYKVYGLSGPYGLKAVNVAAFLLLFAFQYMIGRMLYKPVTVAIALLIFSFYTWTNLNTAAGEQDDMMAALFFTLGVLAYVYGKGAFLSALVMSAGVLFKYTTGIYAGGFLIYLVYTRRWRGLLSAVAAIAIPFLCLNLLTGFSSMETLLSAANLKRHFFNTPLSVVAFKLFSTGMVFSILISAWAVRRDRSDRNVLLFCLSSVYVVFVIVTQNAYTAGFTMMQSVLFSSFLIAEALVSDEYPGGIKQRKALTAAVLILYLLITTVVTVHNLVSDTIPVNPFQHAGPEGGVTTLARAFQPAPPDGSKLFRTIDDGFQGPNNSGLAFFLVGLVNADRTYSIQDTGIFLAQ